MRWLERFALRAVMPSGGPLPGIEATGVDAFLDRFDREAPAGYKLGLLAGGALILASPLLTVRRPVPANWLTPEQLDRHVQRLANHRLYPVRQTLFVVKMVAGLCWGADPAVRATLGLAPLAADPGTWRGDAVAPAASSLARPPLGARVTSLRLDAFRRWAAARR